MSVTDATLDTAITTSTTTRLKERGVARWVRESRRFVTGGGEHARQRRGGAVGCARKPSLGEEREDGRRAGRCRLLRPRLLRPPTAPVGAVAETPRG